MKKHSQIMINILVSGAVCFVIYAVFLFSGLKTVVKIDEVVSGAAESHQQFRQKRINDLE